MPKKRWKVRGPERPSDLFRMAQLVSAARRIRVQVCFWWCCLCPGLSSSEALNQEPWVTAKCGCRHWLSRAWRSRSSNPMALLSPFPTRATSSCSDRHGGEWQMLPDVGKCTSKSDFCLCLVAFYKEAQHTKNRMQKIEAPGFVSQGIWCRLS